MRIAYLINVYPRGNHTFIRREIAGMEAQGFVVDRYSIQYSDENLVDEWNLAERRKTRPILSAGGKGLLLASLRTMLTSPKQYVKSMLLAAKVGWRSERGLLRNLIYQAEACVLLQWLRKTGATHIHAHFGTNSATVAMLTHELGGPPFSFTNHGPDEFDKPEFLGMTQKIHRCAFTVAITSYGRSQLARWCTYEFWDKLRVVRCGVDASFLDKPLTPVPNVPRFVSIGRFCEAKGFLLLIEAVKQLKAKGVEVQVALLGEGPLRKELESRIARWGLGNNIEITGWLSSPDVLKQIQNSRGLVMASFAEGLPVAIMEAMALGRPVISTYIAGIPELVEPGVNGWLVPAGSIDALAKAMEESLKMSPEALTEMGRRGALAVAERHNSMTEAAKLAAMVREVARACPKAASTPERVMQSSHPVTES